MEIALFVDFDVDSASTYWIVCRQIRVQNTTTQVILQALPGSLLIALVVPDLISRGLVGWLALAATLTLMKLTNNMLVSMVGGILMTAACRFTGIAG
jgi:uncharacterized membrane protein